MEAVGLGVGVVGLAGLFSTCISCFELVQRGRYLGKEYLLLETKFANQRLRLLAWGRACGFADSDPYNEAFDDEELRSCIEATLVYLINLFKNGKELRTRYGLKRDQPKQSVRAVASSALDTLVPTNLPIATTLRHRFHEFRDHVSQVQKNAKLVDTVRWAVEDGRKFTELVQHLKDLIDDLENLTKWLGIPERQRKIIQYEVESISDIPTLEIVEEARWGNSDAISDAASLRLWELRDRFREDEQGVRLAHSTQVYPTSSCSTDDEWDDVTNDVQNGAAMTADTCYQVLHRVNCQHEPATIFLDTPSYSSWNSHSNEWVLLDTDRPIGESKALHLCGQRPIPNLDAYLTQNSQLSFVVFKNHKCLHGLEKRTDSDAPVIDQTVYLSSADLCTALRDTASRCLSALTLPEFLPGEELQAPYLWYYHSRHILSTEAEAGARMHRGVRILFNLISQSMADEYSMVEKFLSAGMIPWAKLKYIYVS
jgi:hypothetical protein